MFRILKQISVLFGASLFAALCGLVSLALNTRGLGAQGFGVLSLILAYTALFGGIATFDTWQPVIRLGVRAPRLLGLTLSAGIALDVFAAVAATLAALAGSFILGAWAGIPEDHLWLARIHALSLLAGVAGTPKGYFRLEERFDILAGNQMMLALVMALASAGLWWGSAPLALYVIVFAIIAAVYNLTLFLRMLWALHRSGVGLVLPWAAPRGMRVLRMMFRIATGTSLLSTMSSSRRHLALLIVGALLGETAAGLFAAAARLAAAVSKFSALAMQVLFKTVLQAADRHEPAVWLRMMRRATLISTVAAVFLALASIPGGAFGIAPLLGAGYEAAAPIFSALFAAECAALATLHLNPVIQQKAGLSPLIPVTAIGLVVHLAATLGLGAGFGATGAGVAGLLAGLVMAVLMMRTADRLLRQAICAHEDI